MTITIPKQWLIAILLALASLGWVGVHLYGAQQARNALWRQKANAADSVSRVMAKQVNILTLALVVADRKADSTGKAASATIARYRARRNTPLTQDSITPLLASADSAVSACVDAWHACQQQVASRDSLIAGLRAQHSADSTSLDVWKHKPGAPRFPSCVIGTSGLATVGKNFYLGLGVTCGLRIH